MSQETYKFVVAKRRGSKESLELEVNPINENVYTLAAKELRKDKETEAYLIFLNNLSVPGQDEVVNEIKNSFFMLRSVGRGFIRMLDDVPPYDISYDDNINITVPVDYSGKDTMSVSITEFTDEVYKNGKKYINNGQEIECVKYMLSNLALPGQDKEIDSICNNFISIYSMSIAMTSLIKEMDVDFKKK